MVGTRRLSIFVAVLFCVFAGGYFVGRSTAAHRLSSQASSGTDSWRVRLVPPASVQLPEGKPILRLEIRKSPPLGFDDLSVMMTNLTSRPCTLTYKIYGYNRRGARFSESEAEFVQLGPHESVLRGEMVIPYGTDAFYIHEKDFGSVVLSLTLLEK